MNIDVRDKLHEFLLENECDLCYNDHTRELEVWVHINFWDIEEFDDIVKPTYEWYPKCELQESSLCVFIYDIFRYYGLDFWEFEDCFDNKSFPEYINKWGQ